MVWEGKKLSIETFRLALAFCKWTYDTWKGEAQGKLFFHPGTGDWQFVPLPQLEPSGMTTKECPKDPEYARLLGEWTRKGYVLNGTLHHHCSISSFQSGTDESDEETSNGLHITVGRLNQANADYHSRFVLNKVTYDDIPLSDFIDGDATLLFLSGLPDVPEEWKTVFRERPKYVARTTTTTTTRAKTYENKYKPYNQYNDWNGGWDGQNNYPGWGEEVAAEEETPHEHNVLFFHAMLLSELGEDNGTFSLPLIMGEDDLDMWSETLVNVFTIPDELLEYQFPPLFYNTDNKGLVPKNRISFESRNPVNVDAPSLLEIRESPVTEKHFPELVEFMTSMDWRDRHEFAERWELWLKQVWFTILVSQSFAQG